jgi:spore coat polysaccharide biosynthesis predicted glycosyltransferase SpsG
VSASARILLRCDASSEMGMGHLVRCEALAGALEAAGAGEVRFALRGSPAAVTRAERGGRAVAPLPLEVRSAEAALLRAAADTDAVVFDVREPVPTTTVAALHARGVVCALIDDESDVRRAMDLVFLPPMPQVERLDWSGFAGERHVGFEWVPLRPEFAAEPSSGSACKPLLLVCMGGADPAGLTEQALLALEELELSCPIAVVVGELFPRAAALRELCAHSRHSVELLVGVSDMAGLMRRATLALASFGVTAYELAACGVPALYLSLSASHAECAERFAREGMARHLGQYADVPAAQIAEQVRELLDDAALRADMAKRARATVDGRGAGRIASAVLARVGAKHG